MNEQIQITGISYEVDEATKRYANKRVERLFRYLPKHAKKSVSAEVKLEQVNHDHGNKYKVEIIINVPGKVITASDSTVNIIAAIDIVDAKIKPQIIDYKQTAIGHISRRGVMGRFKRKVVVD